MHGSDDNLVVLLPSPKSRSSRKSWLPRKVKEMRVSPCSTTGGMRRTTCDIGCWTVMWSLDVRRLIWLNAVTATANDPAPVNFQDSWNQQERDALEASSPSLRSLKQAARLSSSSTTWERRHYVLVVIASTLHGSVSPREASCIEYQRILVTLYHYDLHCGHFWWFGHVQSRDRTTSSTGLVNNLMVPETRRRGRCVYQHIKDDVKGGACDADNIALDRMSRERWQGVRYMVELSQLSTFCDAAM